MSEHPEKRRNSDFPQRRSRADDSAQSLRTAKAVLKRHHRAEALAQQKHGCARFSVLDESQKGPEILAKLAPLADIAALTG
jgi:hypothetical protein